MDAQQGAAAKPTEGPPPSRFPPDRLVIPSINLDSPVVPIGWTSVEQGDESTRVWAVADDVVGWHKTSAYPSSSGNVVLNGHHNIKGEVFRYLVDVEIGDRVLVYAKSQIHYYAVTEKHILKEKGEPVEVRRQNAQWIGPTTEERVTMITCWPYTNNTHRLVVVARPVETSARSEIERAQEP
jgi:sortase A